MCEPGDPGRIRDERNAPRRLEPVGIRNDDSDSEERQEGAHDRREGQGKPVRQSPGFDTPAAPGHRRHHGEVRRDGGEEDRQRTKVMDDDLEDGECGQGEADGKPRESPQAAMRDLAASLLAAVGRAWPERRRTRQRSSKKVAARIR